MSNIILEQYGIFKRESLDNSPFKCLLDTKIDINPHQVDAFCAAVKALKTGGIILADEVGLGKTIEAGLVLKYIIKSGARRIILALPATLRKQWQLELDEKFNISSEIYDNYFVTQNYYDVKQHLENSKSTVLIIVSYDYASKLMKRFNTVKWDFMIIDEAHNLRNVFHNAKRAKKLYDISKGIPKVLLTATPIQNYLTDLHGVVSYIDDRIFGEERVFCKRFIDGQDYVELKNCLIPVLYRTLRKDVLKYMDFKKRECRTVDFVLTSDEMKLYAQVNLYLKRDTLYAIPNSNRGLITLVIRKLLASSSFALIETFEVLKERLEKLYEGTKLENAQEGLDFFWQYVEDEIDENDENEQELEEISYAKQQIAEELDEVNAIIENAEKIKINAKIDALLKAMRIAFEYQEKIGIEQKIVVFTESKRTQKYIAAELRSRGYDDVLLFNGELNDEKTKEIYSAWQVKNFGKVNYGRSVEYKHAIVDYFKNYNRILLVTDAGSEGLNLQFCNTVINYDLPWNPQKIEQRIGRCHRYGQKNDVVAINLLNTQNEADKRVYDILSRKFELFEGVFGASDQALGILESGMSFEKMILSIYQNCNSAAEFKSEFDRLDRILNRKRDKKANELKNILMSKDSDTKCRNLDEIKKEITEYLEDVEFWENIPSTNMPVNKGGYYTYIDVSNTEVFDYMHGYILMGVFTDNSKVLTPVLIATDLNGGIINFTEREIVKELLKLTPEMLIKSKLDKNKESLFNQAYDKLLSDLIYQHEKSTRPLKEQNKTKIENWVVIQTEQLNFELIDKQDEINELNSQCIIAKDFLEKVDIKKKIDGKKKQLDNMQNKYHEKMSAIEIEAKKSIEEFNKQFEINPLLLIKAIIKY